MHAPEPATAYLVESIPWGLEELRTVPGVQYTEDVLVRLVAGARISIDLTAMYWSLVPDPEGDDERGFTAEQFDRMGAGTGQALLAALRDAAARGVHLRILESPGFSGKPQESQALQQAAPAAVSVRQIAMDAWYAGGIMHQKLWVFDRRHIYVGSANMDWKSIAQVKEMGVAVEDSPTLAEDATRYFEGFWSFAALPPTSVVAFDPAAGIERMVPPWSALVPKARRADSPLADPRYRPLSSRKAPAPLGTQAPAGVFLTGCPDEVCAPGRTHDGDAIVYTIDDARRSVCVSVMDFTPASLYGRRPLGAAGTRDIPADSPVWWPRLFDALLSAALTRRAHVRLLVSRWAHTSPLIEPFLRALQAAADAGRADARLSAGQLEIKLFEIPGWNSTAGPHRAYPGHSRVNHTKYVVTDRRINIGTSNMTWDYFSCTAGTSVNTDHAGLVQTLQAVFDRDWASRHAFRLS